jgi:hypothetical protein
VSWWTTDRVLALASLFQGLILLAAAIVAWTQAKEARALRKAQAQPYVVVSLQQDPDSRIIVNVIIENYGTTVAKDVRVRIDPPLQSTMDGAVPANRLDKWAAITDGIPTLAPGQRLSHMIDSLHSRYAPGLDILNTYRAKVEYVGDDKERTLYRYEYVLDFSIWRGSHFIGRKTFDDLAKSVEKLADTLSSYGSRTEGLKVTNYDGKTVEREQAEEREAMLQRFAASQEAAAGSDGLPA